MAGLPWVSVGDNCRLTQCWRSAILSDFGAPPRQRTPRPLKCELRPHLRKSWRGRVHCQGRAKRARRVALTVDSSPPIHTQEGEADPKSRPSFTHYFCDRARISNFRSARSGFVGGPAIGRSIVSIQGTSPNCNLRPRRVCPAKLHYGVLKRVIRARNHPRSSCRYPILLSRSKRYRPRSPPSDNRSRC